MSKTYHGWIVVDRDPRGEVRDHFSTQRKIPNQPTEIRFWGHSACAAVDYFETELGLGTIKLESTPIGLRVFTESPDAPTWSKKDGDRATILDELAGPDRSS